MKNRMLTIVIASVPDREELVAELWSSESQVAELAQQDGQLTLQLYKPPSGKHWEFDFDEFVVEGDAVAAFAFIAFSTRPRVLLNEYDPRSFGNAVVVLEGDAVRVKVVRDRDQLFVDLAPRGFGEWFDESVVLQLVGAEETARELAAAEWRELRPSADAIRLGFASVVERFQPERWAQTRVELKALQERRARELFW